MATVSRARSYLRRHPNEAITDFVSLALICGFIVAGFSLPAVL